MRIAALLLVLSACGAGATSLPAPKPPAPPPPDAGAALDPNSPWASGCEQACQNVERLSCPGWPTSDCQLGCQLTSDALQSSPLLDCLATAADCAALDRCGP